VNAKELREAATEVRRCGSEPACDIADYILVTVRDDDDEPVTWDWLAERMTLLPDDRYRVERRTIGSMYVHRHHGPLVFVVNCVEIDGEYAALNPPKTRGQFRSLCRGLGIELKEVGQ
jgi:hypothetical protein